MGTAQSQPTTSRVATGSKRGGRHDSSTSANTSNAGSTQPSVQQRHCYADADGRIVVDIRGANLDSSGYTVWVKQQPPGRDIEASVRSATGTLQALGGVLVTILTVQKLWEEWQFLRRLRHSPSFGDGDPARPGPHSASVRQGDLGAPGDPGASCSGASGAAGRRRGRGRDELDLSEVTTGLGSEGNADAVSFDQIAGLMDCKMILQEATVLPILRPDLFKGIRQPPRGILLFGPPGTGKTLLARAVGAESRAAFLPVTGSTVLSMWYGQSEQNVRALFERARKQQPSIIFVDEVDSLMGKRSGREAGGSSADSRVTNEFLAFIDGIQTGQEDNRIVVIAATNNPWEMDEAALSRFARRIYVPLPDRRTRGDLLRKAMAGVMCDITESEWSHLAEQAKRYSGRDLVQICREASMRPLRELWGARLLGSTGGGAGLVPSESGTQAAHSSAKSSATHAVMRHRLVAAVTAGLERGMARRRLLKELDAWKRKSKADWCNIGQVLQLAEAQQLATRDRGAGSSASAADRNTGGGGGARGDATAEATCSGNAKDDGASHAATAGHGGCCGGGKSGVTTESCPLPPTSAECTSHGGSGVGVGASSKADNASKNPSTAACEEEGRRAEGSAVARMICANVPEPSGSEVAHQTAANTTAVPSVQGSVSQSNIPAASLAMPQAATAKAVPSGAGMAGSGASNSQSTAKAAYSASRSFQKGCAERKSGSTTKVTKAAALGTWSIEELLSLSAGAVRPVKYEDFAAALRTIMPGDFDLTSRYEEWNARHGSGSDAKMAGAHAPYLTMYC